MRSKNDKQIIAEITKLRAICLIHRYLYYVKAAPLVTDQWYDERERRLRELVTQNPGLAFEADNQGYCPITHVGSDNPDDYPRRIEQLAEDILTHKEDYEKETPSTP
jgi:NAD-dependent DNA ligase adenylation domain